MGSATLHHFSRSRVKARMLKKAAELWGYPEAETDAFDPLVSLLLEACSLEFEKIAHEMTTVQSRAVEHLAQIMSPGVDTALPASGVIGVRAAEPKAILLPETQFVYKKPNGGPQPGEGEPSEIYFSPVQPVLVFNGSVRVMADPMALYTIENGFQKTVVTQAGKEAVTRDKYLWLGLELDSRLEAMDGLSFYFGWQHEPDHKLYYPFLPLSKWYLGNVPLSVQPGIPAAGEDNQTAEAGGQMPADDQVRNLFSRCFITIAPGAASVPLRDHRRPYPPELEALFSPRAIASLREPLLWVKVQFPQAMPLEAVKTVHCAINAFPAVNRRLHRLTYRLQPAINIIPLQSSEPFLGVKGVHYSGNRPLTFVPLPAIRELSSGDYSLQYHVSRFDERNAREWLNYLLELVRDESMAFSALGEEFLSSVLRELNQSLARLEQKVQQKSATQPVIPYLVINSDAVGENVYVEYWTTHGGAANKIPATSRLSPYQTSEVQRNEIYLLTSTSGGRAKPGDNDKLRAYKRSLLTRDRVVTVADIEAVCLSELGAKARRVEVRKDFMIGTTPGVGFTRCLRVCITPAENPGMEPAEWEPLCDSLRILLQSRSAIHLPILVGIAV